MEKLNLRINDQTHAALTDMSAKTQIPIASITRVAIEEYLAKHGYKVDTGVKRGGRREKK